LLKLRWIKRAIATGLAEAEAEQCLNV